MAAVVQTKTYAGNTSPVTGAWTSTPTSGNTLVATVNSDTVITTPTGWTLRKSIVSSQGFYIYEHIASGTNDTPSFAFTGTAPTSVTLIELNAAEVGVFDVVGTDTELTTVVATHTIPSVTTTGASGDFLIAVVALHGIGPAQSTFGTTGTWGNSFTALLTSTVNTPTAGASSGAGHFTATRLQATAGAVGTTTVTWTNAAENHMGVVIAYKTIASGTGYTGTPADPVGVTDSVSDVVTVARTQADPVGVTDSVTPVLTPGGTGYTATPADPVGVTDAPTTARTVVVTVTDSLGITDTGTPISFDFGDNRDDPVGVTDSTGVVRTVTTAPADPVGVTDAAATVRAVTKAPGDPVGVTDSVTPVLTNGAVDYTATPADPVGTTDTATSVVDATRTPADPVGLTDSITASLTRVVTIADPVASADTATANLTGAGVVLINDAEPITDAPTWTAGRDRVTADPVGVTDSAVAVLARVYTVTLDELVALHDAAAGVITNQDNQRDITVTGRLVNSTYRARLTPSAYTARIGDTVIIGSTIYQHVALTADHDISGDTVRISLNGGVDWFPLEHVAGTTDSTWRILLGDGQALDPTGDATALVQINDTPEVVIVNAGRFYVTTA